MTTIAFVPNSTIAPPFQALVTLDGVSYNIVAMWSIYRNDWMIQLQDQNGNLISNQPLIGSPPNATIPLFPGFFQISTLAYFPSTGNFVISP